MKILPATTEPPDLKSRRRHKPKPTSARNYRAYRNCLRWEFGFACAFCLLHEVDFSSCGAEGLGVTSVEHFVPVSEDKSRANDYFNCFYACMLCNGVRSNLPLVSEAGEVLLNPCKDTWGQHFDAIGDQLVHKSGDRSAQYTSQCYELNDIRKVRMRRLRRETINQCLDFLKEAYRSVDALLAKGSEASEDLDVSAAARLLTLQIHFAKKQLKRFRAIPVDAPEKCRCAKTKFRLPKWLDDQTFRL